MNFNIRVNIARIVFFVRLTLCGWVGPIGRLLIILNGNFSHQSARLISLHTATFSPLYYRRRFFTFFFITFYVVTSMKLWNEEKNLFRVLLDFPAVRRTQPTTKKAKISSTTHVQMLQWLHGKQQQQQVTWGFPQWQNYGCCDCLRLHGNR